MEPSSRCIDDEACWYCPQQGRVNIDCCENYEGPTPRLSHAQIHIRSLHDRLNSLFGVHEPFSLVSCFV